MNTKKIYIHTNTIKKHENILNTTHALSENSIFETILNMKTKQHSPTTPKKIITKTSIDFTIFILSFQDYFSTLDNGS
jgi:hypothetical protein